MSQMKLYSHLLCPFVQRVKIGIHERQAGAHFLIQEVDLDAPPAALIAINPAGSVPTLEFAPGDGFNESLVVLEFLDTLETKGPRLFGDSPREAGKTKVLLEQAGARFLGPIQSVLYAKGNAVVLRKAVAGLPGAFEWLSGVLQARASLSNTGSPFTGSPFLGGTKLGAVDCALAPFILRYALMREQRKELPLPREGTLAAAYFHALLDAPAVVATSPSADDLRPVFARMGGPDESLSAVLLAARAIVPNPEERCGLLNQALASIQPRNVRPSAGAGEPVWRLERAPKGPQIAASFKLPGYAEMLQAIEALTGLQESADHHSHFVLEGYESLAVTLCTHEPEWGLSDKDFAFAQALTEKLLRL